MVLTCLTLNTWKNEGGYAARLEAMAAGLAAENADVVALQECFAAPPRFDTAGVLAARLGMHLSRAPMRAKPRWHEGAEIASSADLALLTRQPPAAVQTLALPQDPRDGERLAQIVDLEIAALHVRIVNTHLTHLPGAKDLRHAQAAALMAAATAGAPGPIVLMGDFNAMADDPCLAPIFEHPWLDPPAKAAALTGTNATDRLRAGAIDHVLLFDPSGTTTLQARRLCLNRPDAAGAFPSDHPGVRADIVPAHNKIHN